MPRASTKRDEHISGSLAAIQAALEAAAGRERSKTNAVGLQRLAPSPIPSIPARRRSAPTVRFISFEIFSTGVLALECALRLRTSSFVHGFITRTIFFGISGISP